MSLVNKKKKTLVIILKKGVQPFFCLILYQVTAK